MKMKYSTHLLTSIGFSSLQIHKIYVKQLSLSSTAMHDGDYKYRTKIYTRSRVLSLLTPQAQHVQPLQGNKPRKTLITL